MQHSDGKRSTGIGFIYKAEMLEKGANARFMVTSRLEGASDLYHWYVRRGETEGWIKDFKIALSKRAFELPPLYGQPISLTLTRRGLLAAR